MIAAGSKHRARAVQQQTEGGPIWARLRSTRSKEPKPFLEVLFRIAAGEHKGEEYFWQGYLSEKAAARTLESLQACGMAGDDIRVVNLAGLPNEVEVQIDHDTYKGTTTARIAFVNAPGRGETAPSWDEMAERVKQIVSGDVFGGDDVGF